MMDDDLEARLDARLVRNLKEMASEPYKRFVTALLEKMELKVTGGAVMDDVAFLEGEREGTKYLIMASRKPEHASLEGVHIAKERAMAEKRSPVLIVANDMDQASLEAADKEEVSTADRAKLIVLIKRFDLSGMLTKDSDRVLLRKEGSRVLPSTMPFDSLLQDADEQIKRSEYKEALKDLDAALAIKSEHDLAWRMKASTHFYLGEHDQALEAIGQALRIRPGDPTTWYMAGIVLHQMGRLEDEVSAYDRALLYARRMYPALLNKGATLFSLGRKEEALATFDELLRIYPNDHQGLNNRGLVLRSLGRNPEALEAFEVVSSLDPDNLEAQVNKASLLTDMGRSKESISAWKEAVAADRKRADLWLRLGQAQKAAGMLAEAEESFSVAERLDRGLKEAKEGREAAQEAMVALEPLIQTRLHKEESLAKKYLDASLLLQAIGRQEDALREADKALEFERSPNGLLRKSSILLEMGRMEEAIAVLSKGIRDMPQEADIALELEAVVYRLGRREEGARLLKPFLEDAEARKRAAVTEVVLGRKEEALTLLNWTEGADPLHDRIRALALMVKGEHAEAVDLLLRLSGELGGSPQTLNDLGVALRFSGRLEEAEEALHKAIEAEPRYADAWNNLGCVHYLQGGYEQAEHALKEAILLDRRPVFLLHLGMCQLGRNDLDAAEESFGSALRLDASAEAYNALGMVAERRKELVKALELYEEALVRSPEFRDAQYNKARVKAALKG
ncbi:MAG TPA: tetratricopeptide repeat protein [Methanomassiliicoccales archaeon]|nr:tetratricopeptide repeat protein [Methanomassiliicoccales archaeon]